MKKIIIAPDSFKGSLSAIEVCRAVKEGLLEKGDFEIEEIPVADGGEGTVDSFLSIFGGEEVFAEVKGPLFKNITARYAFLNNETAVIEMASASGLTVEKEKKPMRATTYGTGQLILSALEKGAKRIVLGIGGSATTDGGVGCAQALGARFLRKDGKEISLGGEGLLELSEIDLKGLDRRLSETELLVLCDVKNSLYGKNGAAYVFASQKGASEEEIEVLNRALKNLAEVSEKALKKDYAFCEGAGAAGGLGFACIAFLGGKLVSGIDYVLKSADFENKAKKASLVITGEGKTDSQSLMGKVLTGITQKSGKTKVAVITGVFEGDEEAFRKIGVTQIVEVNKKHLPFEEILATAYEDLREAAKNIKTD
ncbi:MAG: glycerate kinase [Clostridia bacterium]|nr:glycerate kinase [Clostridia bacterium]